MPAYDRNGPWSDERIETLRRMWGAKCSASAIMRELNCGISRNAVVGKAARLGLERRSSPIRRDKAECKSPSPHIHRVRDRNKRLAAQRGATTAKQEAPPPETPTPRPAPILRLDSRSECRWPIGDPKAKDFRFCNVKPIVAGKPYCHEHYLLSIKPSEEAA